MDSKNAEKNELSHTSHFVKIALSIASVLFGIVLLMMWLNSSREINPIIIFSILFIIGGIILFTKYGE